MVHPLPAATVTTEPQGIRAGSAAELVDADALVALAAQLVRFRSVHDSAGPASEQAVAEFLADLMRGFGWTVAVTDVAPGRPNVVGVVTGARPGGTLMFEGHTDVVTEADRSLWSFDPYGGDVVDGMLRGRGSADMKGGIAAMIHAARALQLRGFDGRIIVAALADEEGMMLGAKSFAASALAGSGIDGVIVCEPEDGEVCTAAKGALRIRIELRGRMAHGAMPNIGCNPVPALGAVLVELAELQGRVQRRVGTHPQLGDVFITPTVVRAGSAAQMNVIPAAAEAHCDIRTVPNAPHPELLAEIESVCARIADGHGLGWSVDVIDDRPPVDTPRDAPVVRALAASHREITGREPVFGAVPGTTDGTILSRDAGLTTVVYGPGGKWIAHQVDEMCAVDDIVTAARVYADTAQRFLATPLTGSAS